MAGDSVKGLNIWNRMTDWLDDIVEIDELSSDENEPQHPMKETRDWTLELEMYRAKIYHYRQPILMYTIACELEFLGGYTYATADLENTRAVVLLWRSAKFDLETLDWLKHGDANEPAHYQTACIGFKKLYGLHPDKLISRVGSLHEEVLECLERRVILKCYSGWAIRPEEQRKLIEICDWIINTYLQFPADKINAAFTRLCRTMGGKSKTPVHDSVKDSKN